MNKSEIIMRKSPKFMLGADPEFILYKEGRWVKATNYLVRSTSTKLGTDGHADTGEMRPDAFYKANKLFGEVDSILRELGRIAVENRLEAHAGSGETNGNHRDPTGGHIHYSDEVKPTAHFLVACNRLFTLPLNTVSNTRNRHTYLLPQFLVSELGDTPTDWRGRPMNEADYHADFVDRAKAHRVWDTCHAHPGFEYRLVLSWLCHPVIARGTLTLAKLIGKIQIVFGDAELKLLNTENIYDYANKFEQRHIKRFYAMIAGLKRTRKRLEDFDIIKTWRVGKHGRPARMMYDVEYTYDDNLPMIRDGLPGLKCSQPITFVGAGAHRGNDKTVFLPTNSLLALPSVIRWCKVIKLPDYTARDDSRQIIGLSYKLRADIDLSQKVIKAIVAFLDRPRAINAAPAVASSQGRTITVPDEVANISEAISRADDALFQPVTLVRGNGVWWYEDDEAGRPVRRFGEIRSFNEAHRRVEVEAADGSLIDLPTILVYNRCRAGTTATPGGIALERWVVEENQRQDAAANADHERMLAERRARAARARATLRQHTASILANAEFVPDETQTDNDVANFRDAMGSNGIQTDNHIRLDSNGEVIEIPRENELTADESQAEF